MLDEGQPLSVMITGLAGDWGAGDDSTWIRPDGEATLLPLYLDP